MQEGEGNAEGAHKRSDETVSTLTVQQVQCIPLKTKNLFGIFTQKC